MAKLNISDFDDFKFETELASESFYTSDGKARIALKCAVKPTTNEVEYYVLVQCIPCAVYRFVFLEDAIFCYNNKLEGIKGE